MPASIYIYSNLSLGRSRSELEDDIDEVLAGIVEVTGGGAGKSGWNIDLKVVTQSNVNEAVDNVVAYLRNWGVPDDTYVEVVHDERADGQRRQRINILG